MRYPAPNYTVPPPPPPSGGLSGLAIFGIVVAVVATLIIVLGVALGVGLGVGLTRNSGGSSSSNSGTISFSSVANCNYSTSVCGCAVTKPENLTVKIINGYDATAHSWPWIVTIGYQNSLLCGGFLVESYQYVITAGHCLHGITDKTTIRVYAGLQTLTSSAGAQYRDVSDWTIHPGFTVTASHIYNDITVIKLQSSFDKSDNVGLCCLPSGTTQLPILGEFAVIAGWGQTQYNVPTSQSNTLMQAVIQIQGSSSYCDASDRSDIQFCAGYGTSDSCQGDSGGPLMTVVDDAWTCTGIVSYGVGCGNPSYYTRVSYFRSFIDQTIATL